MTKLKSIIGLFITTSAVVASVEASAERYMVKMRSPMTFKAETQSFKDAFKNGHWGRSHSSRIFGDRVRFVDSLVRGNLMIIETTDKATIAALKMNPEVEYVEQERWIKVPKLSLSQKSPYTSQATSEEIPWGLEAVKAQEAWDRATTGAQGLGARVAVIDSGIDRSHVDLQDRFEKGKDFLSKPRDGFDFSKKILSSMFTSPIDDVLTQEPNDMVPYPYFDLMGHGTHVAGTIAASANQKGVVGVAPQAQILAARVCGFMGCSSVGIVRAIDWAIEEKVDVINMSLGGPFPSRAQLEAAERAEAAGVTVVAASGNDGSDRLGYPAGFPTVVSVGAVGPDLTRATFSQYGEGLTITAPGTEVNSTVPAGTGRSGKVWISVDGVDEEVTATSFLGSNATQGIVGADLIHAKIGTKENFAEISQDNLRGKFALIQRGVIPFVEKVENAISAGAAGVIIYNNTPGLAGGALTDDGSDIGLPVLMVEQGTGEALAARLVVGDSATARVQVLATDYAAFQGTSMASPHVAGVVALIKAANKALTPEQVRMILKISADKQAHMNTNEYGAGLSNALNAIEFVESTRKHNWDYPNESGSSIASLKQ